MIVFAGFGSAPEECPIERSLISTGSDSSFRSLEDEDEERESSDAVNFLGPSDNVALVSEPTINFFAFCLEEPLSESDDESADEAEDESEAESESGSGIF
jgi:hypothetical protein